MNKAVTDKQSDDQNSNSSDRRELLTLIKHSLLSVIYQNRYYRVEISQLLNRFFALIQDDVAIVVLDKVGVGEDIKYKIIYHTMLDPVWQRSFEEMLLRAGTLKGDHIYWDKDYSKNNIFVLHDTKRFAFYRYKLSDDHPYDPPVYRLCNEQEREEFLITDFLKEFKNKKHSLHKLYLSEGLNEKFDDRAKYWDNGHYNIYEEDVEGLKGLIEFEEAMPEVQHAVEDLYADWPDDFFTAQQEKISAIFEKEYSHIKNSPLLYNQTTFPGTKNIANIVFSARSFTSDKMRYRGRSADPYYAYETRTYLPKSQRDELCEALDGLKKKNIPPDKQFDGDDQFFWDHVDKKEFDAICDIIESPEGENARALSDQVYTSGFVRISGSPFRTKGNNRLDDGVWQQAQKGALTDDYKRLVCHCYLGYLMVPTESPAATFLVPVQVGGSPWACLGFFYDKNKLQRHEQWICNYHYYHSAATYMIRNIRIQLKKLYLDSIETFYGLLLSYFLDGPKKREERILSAPYIFVKAFNQCSNMIARMFPFSQLVTDKIDSSDKNNTAVCRIVYKISNRYDYVFSLRENPFFTKRISGPFVSIDDIVRCFRQAEYKRAIKNQLERAQASVVPIKPR